jgi:hypothetical protein
MGRIQLNQDFSKGIAGFSIKPEISNTHVSAQSGYNYLYADTLFELRKVLARLDANHIDCYLLCLRILSRVINEFKNTNEYA